MPKGNLSISFMGMPAVTGGIHDAKLQTFFGINKDFSNFFQKKAEAPSYAHMHARKGTPRKTEKKALVPIIKKNK